MGLIGNPWGIFTLEGFYAVRTDASATDCPPMLLVRMGRFVGNPMPDRSLAHQPGYVRFARIAATVLLPVAAVLTMLLVCRTFWYLLHSVTNVPYADQWVM